MPAHQARPVPNRESPERGGQRAARHAVAHHAGRFSRALVCVAVLAFGSGWAHADSDSDRARQALQAGEVLPLATILERVAREHPGKVLDVELERDKVERGDQSDGARRWVYQIKLLTPSGTRLKLLIDAKSGVLIAAKRRD